MDVAEEFSGGGVDSEELVGAGGGRDESFVVGADFDREWSGESLRWYDLRGREGFKVDEAWFFCGVLLEIDPGDLIEEGAVLKFGEAMFFCARSAVDVIAGIGLGDEDRAFGIDGEAVEKGAKGVDRFDEAVGPGVEDEEIFIGDVGVFDDVENVSKGEDVVVGDGVLMGVEGDEVAIDFVAAGELGFVVGLEGDDVKFSVADGDGAGVLGGDGEVFGDLSGGDVDDGDFVFG